jgi:hypothetical protein
MLNNIKLERSPVRGPNAVIGDLCELIDYSSEWTDNEWGFNPHHGTVHFTNTAGAFAQLIFLATSVTYLASRNMLCGIAEIYIDGVKDAEIDLYSPEQTYTQPVYTKNGLAFGYHTIRIVCAGRNNSEALAADVTLDSFLCETDQPAKKPAVNSLAYLSIDTATQGSWKNRYGREGYDIVGASRLVPTYAGFTYTPVRLWYHEKNTGDVKALQKPGTAEGRIAAKKYAVKNLSIDVVVGGDKPRNFSMYLIEYEKGLQFNAELRIEAINGDNGEVLDKRQAVLTEKGLYLNYAVKGHIVFKVTKAHPATKYVMFSGLFFD